MIHILLFLLSTLCCSRLCVAVLYDILMTLDGHHCCASITSAVVAVMSRGIHGALLCGKRPCQHISFKRDFSLGAAEVFLLTSLLLFDYYYVNNNFFDAF